MGMLEAGEVRTHRLRVNCWTSGPEDGTPLLFVHGNLVSGRWFEHVAEHLPGDIRVVAPDLRGFGGTEPLPVDATRGLRDWSDDVAAVVDALGWAGSGRVHVVGWSLGGAVVEQYAIDHPDDLASVALLAPVSPFGFGGTRLDGSPVAEDYAGTGGGGVNPDFSRRLAARDPSEEDPLSSPRVIMRTYFYDGTNAPPEVDEQMLFDEFMKTVCGDDNYPGTMVPCDHWPGFGPGDRGGQNAMSPKYCDTTAFAGIDPKPPVLWIRGSNDPVVSDRSAFDFGVLGEMGAVPGWPGEDGYPAQPQVAQTRALLERYAAAGGSFREVCLEGVGHGALVERPSHVAELIADHVGAATAP